MRMSRCERMERTSFAKPEYWWESSDWSLTGLSFMSRRAAAPAAKENIPYTRSAVSMPFP